jgi:hypothetical protein
MGLDSWVGAVLPSHACSRGMDEVKSEESPTQARPKGTR